MNTATAIWISSAKRPTRKTSETLAFTGNFDIERVLFDQMKNIVGLVGGGTKEMNFTNPGKFNALVQRNAKGMGRDR